LLFLRVVQFAAKPRDFSFPTGNGGNGMAHSLWGFRPSRFSSFAACSGAPSHRPSQGLGLRQFSERDYSRDLRPAEWGSGVSLRRQQSGAASCPPWPRDGLEAPSPDVRFTP
jgi:hypothetical protein